jgi:hypothetical protein
MGLRNRGRARCVPPALCRNPREMTWCSSSVWYGPDVCPGLQTCFHEGGHAVICEALGIPLERVTVWPSSCRPRDRMVRRHAIDARTAAAHSSGAAGRRMRRSLVTETQALGRRMMPSPRHDSQLSTQQFECSPHHRNWSMVDALRNPELPVERRAQGRCLIRC